jgi:phosphocarrier protein
LISAKYTIKNEEGLHARPATDFCKTAMKYKSEIVVRKNGEEYKAKSILSVLSMSALKGEEIEIQAEGIDEEAALNELILVLKQA